MLNLFENYTEQEMDLERSLQESGYVNPTVVLNDEGYLPVHVQSPIGFFTEMHQLAGSKNLTPKFFNEVAVPNFWEIKGDGQKAEIFEGYKKKGHIHYSKRREDYRAVSAVEWFNEEERLRSVDLYNQYGGLFGKKTYSDGQLTLTTYFNPKGQEVLLFNHVTQTIQVNYEGKIHFFESFNDFILFYFKVAQIHSTNIFYNSLGRPFFITSALQRENPQKVYSHTLFWQEESQVMPGNMTSILENESSATKHIVIQNREEYVRLQKQVPEKAKVSLDYLGYLYPLSHRQTLNKSALVLTNSDDIAQLESLVKSLPHHHFNIAARTTMSTKLMAFDAYSNVTLYPTVEEGDLQDLMDKSSLYLDINHGNEVEHVLRKAFEKDQLIMAFKETLHNKRYVAPEHIFEVKAVKELKKMIEGTTRNTRVYRKALSAQWWAAGQSTVEDYKEVLG